jgi:2-methylcitrate dehydratase PrpD
MRAIDMPHRPGESLSGQLEHDPEKPAPDSIRGGNRLSEKIMLKRNESAMTMRRKVIPARSIGDRRSSIREERMNAPVTVLKSPQPESVASALVSEELARFVGAFATAAIPAAVTARAKHLILDAVGIALASTSYDFAHRAMTAIAGLAGAGDFPVIGLPARLPLRDAALINGILVHGLDFDDTHSGGVIHATSSVLPTVLAVGAQQHASGREMLAAYVLGVEVAARLGAVAKGAFHQVGFHPTGLIGAFACALAAGRLMGLNEKQLVMAQGLTLSAGSGSLEFLEDGAWNKRFHPGWAAVSGITAAALARQGFVGAKRAYEGRFGLYASHLQSHFDPANLALATAGLGEVWELQQVAVKPYPACHFVHACVDAAVTLTREHKLDAKEIEQVRALVPAEVVKTVCEPAANKRRPANSYDAQFSIPYTVAAGLRRGQFTLDELEDDALGDPDILALADRVQYEIDPATTFPRHYTGEVIVNLRGGRTLRHREAVNRGNGERPLSEADIIEKFRSNAARAVSRDKAHAVETLLLSLDQAADAGGLADRLAGA